MAMSLEEEIMKAMKNGESKEVFFIKLKDALQELGWDDNQKIENGAKLLLDKLISRPFIQSGVME